MCKDGLDSPCLELRCVTVDTLNVRDVQSCCKVRILLTVSFD